MALYGYNIAKTTTMWYILGKRLIFQVPEIMGPNQPLTRAGDFQGGRQNMRTALVIALFLILSGCAGFTDSRATVALPDGDAYVLTSSSSETLVTFKKSAGGDIEIVMDNQPRPGLIEKILTMMFLKTDVNVGVK